VPERTEPLEVLVAEDESVSRRRLEGALAAWGFAVRVARDGAEAWRLFEQHAPPLVVIDWIMPGLDGVELCRRIRAHSAGARTHVILLSARGERGDRVAGLEAGADDYLAKPFDRAELRARLRVGERVLALQRELQERVRELELALSQVKQLRGLLPICAYCKKVRDDQDYWHQIESYVAERTEASFSHGICPHCAAQMREELARARRRRGR
jgi:DNA-binding response OmpR family regulator